MKQNSQKVRFHLFRVRFNPEMSFAPRLNQAEAVELFMRGDLNKLIEGHAWLACDIAERVLSKLKLPSERGEDFMAEGLLAIVETVNRLKKCPKNFSAYLSQAIENKMVEFFDRDSLCPVPGRTKRDRFVKGMPKVDAPTISVATDLKRDERETYESVLSRLRRSSSPSDLVKPEDLYEYCQNQLDCDIVDLRHTGSVPRAMQEVAELTGFSRHAIERRLNALEARVYADLEKPMPTCARAKGIRLLAPRPKKHSGQGTNMAISV